MARRLTFVAESFPIRGSFRISRGAKTEARVLTVRVEEEGIIGWGEGVPYPRYGESIESSSAELLATAGAIAEGASRVDLLSLMRPGAARAALDAALWDLEAKITGVPVWRRLGMANPPPPVTTAFTLSLDTPDKMAEAARASLGRPLFKMKLAGEGDVERVAAVREAAPGARLIVDANEGWTRGDYERNVPAFAALGVEMIEQPFPAGRDRDLEGLERPIPVAADESVHGVESLSEVVGRYDVACLKLDKTGGLTAGLEVRRAAESAGLDIMVGCMVSTSLAMAPALLLARDVRYVDLDGPLLLADDRPFGLCYLESVVHSPEAVLWG